MARTTFAREIKWKPHPNQCSCRKQIKLGQTEIDGHGFTLVELLVAITVLSALIAIAASWFANYTTSKMSAGLLTTCKF